jgi:hypothetical protein
MKLKGIIWLRDVVDKLLWKHSVTTNEVEEVFSRSPRYHLVETGDVEGENLYSAHGQKQVVTLSSSLFSKRLMKH